MTLSPQFSTRQMLNILDQAGLRLESERLKVWHRRGIAPGEPAGKGHERSYTLRQLIKVASLVFVSRRIGRLYGQGAELGAYGLANDLAEAVFSVYKSGPAERVARSAPLYILTESPEGETVLQPVEEDANIRTVAELYATGAATIVHAGFFALRLAAAIERTLHVPV